MSNESRMLYVGVTNDIHKRVFQHKSKLIPGFTQKYNLYKLVYFEMFGDIRAAIAQADQGLAALEESSFNHREKSAMERSRRRLVQTLFQNQGSISRNDRRPDS
jgi:hypothetical protein